MFPPRIVLAFDTAMAGCSVALLDVAAGRCTADSAPMTRGQSESLVPMIEAVLEKAGRSFSDVDLIGTTIGPGAFTGLRIGLSTARALGLALDRPVIGVTTTGALARKHGPADNLAVILETKRSDFYIQIGYGAPEALSADVVASRLAGRSMILIGDALDRFRAAVPPEPGWTFTPGYELADPGIIAQIAAEEYLQTPQDSACAPPAPLYLREADVSKSKRPLRRIEE